MTQLTKQQAAMLYAYDYKLVDKENKVWLISSVGTSRSFLPTEPDEQIINLIRQTKKGGIVHECIAVDEIGTDYFIMAHPLTKLTEEIEHNGEKFVPIHKLFDIEYAGTSHVENVRNQYFSNTGRFVSSSHFGTASDTSVNVLNIESNNYWKMNKLHEWRFNIDFPEHTVKHLI